MIYRIIACAESSSRAFPRRVLVWPLVLALFVPQGCAHARETTRTHEQLIPPDEDAAASKLKEAREASEARETARARSLLHQLLREHRRQEVAAVARLQLAELELQEGRVDAAREHAEAGLALRPDDPVRSRLRLIRAELILIHDARTGFGELRALRDQPFEPQYRQRYVRSVSDAAKEPSLRKEVIKLLISVEKAVSKGDEQRDYLHQLRRVLQQTDDAELEAVLQTAPRGSLGWREVALELLKRLTDTGQEQRAASLRALVRQHHPNALDALSEPEAGEVKFGVILPLSGKSERLGRKVLNGLLLAQQEVASKAHLVIKDNRSDPHVSVRLVEELINKDGVRVILGPLSRQTALAAARRASELHTPIVTFTAEPSAAKLSPLSFRMFLSLRGELEALVSEAVHRGGKRIGIIHPENSYGRAAHQALSEVLSQHRLAPPITRTYVPGTRNFSDVVEGLTKDKLDAVVLADGAVAVALIAPALAASGIWSSKAAPQGRQTTFLVSSAGFDLRLLQKVQRYIDGALFSVPYNAQLNRDYDNFSHTYFSNFSEEPDVFSAFSYNAYRVIDEACRSTSCKGDDLAQAMKTAAPQKSLLTLPPRFGSDGSPAQETELYQATLDGFRKVGE